MDMLEKRSFAPMRAGYCGANMGMYTIDPDGDIYPCWDVLTEETCRIGHVNLEKGEFEFNGKADQWKNISL
ncbi:MAG: SPASM domain-containing protein [Eubacteriales bacterium]|nr:SPASM domain-containing protein [Eubacteriales bacterium]